MKNRIRDVCVFADGFKVSIQASEYHRCSPQSDEAPGGYEEVELGFPSEEEPLLHWYAEEQEAPTKTVYNYVPASVVRDVIAKHGGLVSGELPPLAESK